MKQITIIIPIYNRLNVTKEGMHYIQGSLDTYNALPEDKRKYIFDVVVVDDGSTDGSPEWIKENYPSIEVIKTPGDLWWTGSANFGVSHVLKTRQNLQGIVMQNDDVVVEEDWVECMARDISREPEALIGCATTSPGHKDEIEFGGINTHPWFAHITHINRNRKRSEFPKGHLEPSFYLSGRGLYIPASVFAKIGLFDQKGFKHRGDVDIPLRAKKAGYKLLVSYDAIVYELPQHTFGLDIKKKISLKELYKAMTDFRSSYSVGYVYSYSKAATRNALQFGVFFFCNFSFHMKALLSKYFKQYI
ncbi:MAG: glycosyltransferase family 2 protein [Flavitalea sp.]